MRDTLAAIRYMLTLRCEEADRIACIEGRSPLRRRERIGAALHRAICRSCRRAREQVRRLDRMIEQLPPDAADEPGASR